MPGVLDTACVGAGHTVKVSGGTEEVGALRDEGGLVVSGGSLVIVGSVEASSVESLDVYGGVLELGGGLHFEVGTFLQLGGETVIGAGAQVRAVNFDQEGGRVSIGTGVSMTVEKLLYVENGPMDVASGSTITVVSLSLSEVIGTRGELVIAGSSTVKAEEVYAEGHGVVLAGAGVLEATFFYWSSGTIAGPGTIVALKEADCTPFEGRTCILQEHRLVALEWGEVTGSASTPALEMSDGAVLENRGAFDANAEDTAGPSMKVATGSTVQPEIINSGEFKKTAHRGVTDVTVPFVNLGTVHNFSEGQLVIDGAVVPGREHQYGPENPAEKEKRRALCGDPVDCVTGNLTETQNDLAVGGRGVGLDWTRYYNAQAAASGRQGIFGYGWSTAFSDHLEFNTSTHTVTVVQANGSTVTFTEEGGSFRAPVWTQYTLAGGSGEGYTLTTSDKKVYRFAGSGRLESVTDRNGNATTLGYNGAGRLATITDPSGRKITLAYNPEGLVESATDPMGHTVRYAYREGSLASVTLPGGSASRWQFEYDARHRITKMVDGRGGETQNTYNGEDQVVSQSDPMGRRLKWQYEAFATKVTNEATGGVTLYDYDSDGHLTEVAHGYGTPSETKERLIHDEAGDTTTRKDGDGHTTRYEYDSAGDRTKTIDPEGHETRWAYNAMHEVTSETSPAGETTSTEYDEHGNPVKVFRLAPHEASQVSEYKWTSAGQLESYTDPLGRTWRYEHDAYGDKTGEIDPAGDKRTWGFNEDSQETSTVSPRGNVEGGESAVFTTTIGRDQQGRPVLITEPEPNGTTTPVNVTPASVIGVPVEGATLAAAVGLWRGTPSLAYGYQWQRCNALGSGCASISGATGSTHTVVAADLKDTLRIVVTATNAHGSSSSSSAASAVVSAVAPPVYVSSFGSKGNGSGQFVHPDGVAVDAHGHVWVVDAYNNRIEKFSSSGEWLATCGRHGTGNGEFAEPTAIVVNTSTGDVYIADQNNARVQELNEECGFIRAWGVPGTGHGQFHEPNGVAIGSAGTVFVGDYANNTVQKFTAEGEYLTGWGSNGTGNGQFKGATYLAVYGGRVYVGDSRNGRIEMFSEEGAYETKLGS
jgi:YD repeat-containing protein